MEWKKFKGTGGNWKQGKHASQIVSDQKPERSTYKISHFESEREYYGGYLIAESISCEADNKVMAAGPELIKHLQESQSILESMLGYFPDGNFSLDSKFSILQQLKLNKKLLERILS